MNPKKKNFSSPKNNPDEVVQRQFVQKLLTWNKKGNTRKMPWKGEKRSVQNMAE